MVADDGNCNHNNVNCQWRWGSNCLLSDYGDDAAEGAAVEDEVGDMHFQTNVVVVLTVRSNPDFVDYNQVESGVNSYLYHHYSCFLKHYCF